MVERNGPSLGGGLCNKPSEPLCCVSVNKIFDSVRDKDCLEDLRVYLCDSAQEVVDRATAIRTRPEPAAASRTASPTRGSTSSAFVSK